MEIGKLLGMRVIAAASSAEKLAAARDRGADESIDYSSEDLRERIKALTDGRGVDVVYDPVGGDFAEPALRSVGWRGRYLVVGFAAGDIPKIRNQPAAAQGSSLVGVFWGRVRPPRASALNMQNATLLFSWLHEEKDPSAHFQTLSTPCAGGLERSMPCSRARRSSTRLVVVAATG